MSVKVFLIIILILLCYVLFTEMTQPTIYSSEDKVSVPKHNGLKGKSPEGLPLSVVKSGNFIISPSILKESELQEDGLMLDGSDVAVLPALASSNKAEFDIKLLTDQDSTFFTLETESAQNYIILCQVSEMLCLKLCLSDNTNMSREFIYKFVNKLQKDWTNVKILIEKTLITFVIGKDVLKETRHPKDTFLPTDLSFHTLNIGGSKDDDIFTACKINKLNFFGTKFGEFTGTQPAIFPLNLRKHLTIYPIDISFSLQPETNGTLLVIYENDKNYLKIFLKDFRLNIILKSKDRKYFSAFKQNLEPNKLVSIKLLLDNYITVNFLTKLDSHSTIAKEQSTPTSLEDTDIYWLSAARRIFLGGVPFFPHENFKGKLYNVAFRDVTSLI